MQTEAELVAAWSEWLGIDRWNYVADLTFGRPVGAETAAAHFRSWIRSLERSTSLAVPWFFCLETSAAGVLHIHALLHLPPDAPREQFQTWKKGRFYVEPLESLGAAVKYRVKAIARSRSYDRSKRPPPRCTAATST
jgi:hypothetical protein